MVAALFPEPLRGGAGFAQQFQTFRTLMATVAPGLDFARYPAVWRLVAIATQRPDGLAPDQRPPLPRWRDSVAITRFLIALHTDPQWRPQCTQWLRSVADGTTTLSTDHDAVLPSPRPSDWATPAFAAAVRARLQALRPLPVTDLMRPVLEHVQRCLDGPVAAAPLQRWRLRSIMLWAELTLPPSRGTSSARLQGLLRALGAHTQRVAPRTFFATARPLSLEHLLPEGPYEPTRNAAVWPTGLELPSPDTAPAPRSRLTEAYTARFLTAVPVLSPLYRRALQPPAADDTAEVATLRRALTDPTADLTEALAALHRAAAAAPPAVPDWDIWSYLTELRRAPPAQ